MFLQELSSRLQTQTVFVYWDPFGLTGREFATLEPFLTRSKAYSTEIVLNISMPITHRLASANAIAEGRGDDPQIIKFHQRLTKVFGGNYWKDIYFSGMEAEEKEFALMQEYQNRISQHLPFTGSCPVRESTASRIKYFITLASRHPDAMLLMNDEMCKAYHGQMHEADFTGTLFEKLDWKSMRTRANLDSIILEEVKLNPGGTRQQLWLHLIQKHFMQYTRSEYRKRVQSLVSNRRIHVEYTSTGRLNDQCRLFPI